MVKIFLKRFFSSKMTVISFGFIVLLMLLGAFAPYIAPNDPVNADILQKLQGPSAQFPLGTDHLGRCVLSRLIYAIPYSLFTAIAVVLIITSVALVVGCISGYYGGWIDNVFMRFCDIFLVFPRLILVLAIVGMLGQGLRNILLASCIVGWVFYARMVRSMVLSIKNTGYISAANVFGTSSVKIIFSHVLVNILPEVIVLATLEVGWIILSLSGLSFLGLGIEPPTPEWGSMLNDGRNFMRSNPSLMFYPGMIILLTASAFNLLGDGLRDALDPQEAMRDE